MSVILATRLPKSFKALSSTKKRTTRNKLTEKMNTRSKAVNVKNSNNYTNTLPQQIIPPTNNINNTTTTTLPSESKTKILEPKVFYFSYAANEPIEDKYFVNQSEGFFGVFDGHGGASTAHFAKDNLWCLIKKSLDENDPPEEAIKKGFIECDKCLLEVDNQKSGMVGTCAIVCLLRDDKIYIGNVGDSRAVLGIKRNDDKVIPYALSTDQNTKNENERKLVVERSGDANAIRMNAIDAIDGNINAPRRVAGCLLVTRAIGDFALKQYITAVPEIKHHTFCPKTDLFLVIASDGVWDHMTNEEVVSFVREHSTSPNVSQLLVDKVLGKIAAKKTVKKEYIEALPAGAQRRLVHDDMTVIIIMFMTEEEQLENSLDEETDVESEKDDSVSPKISSTTYKTKSSPLQRQSKSPSPSTPTITTSSTSTTTTNTYVSSSTQKKSPNITPKITTTTNIENITTTTVQETPTITTTLIEMTNIESTTKRKADVLDENDNLDASDEEPAARSPKKKRRVQVPTSNKKKKIN